MYERYYGDMKILGYILLALSLGVSCARVGDDPVSSELVAPGGRASLVVSFVVDSERLCDVWGGGEALGAGATCSRSISNPGTDTDEGTSPGYVPRDVWVIQYGGTADNVPLVGLPRYVKISGATQIQSVASDAINTLVFVANTHDANLELGDISTLGKMKLACEIIARESDLYGSNVYAENDLILSGKYEGLINSSAISVELFRNIVRIDFTLHNSAGSGMTLQSVQLCNVHEHSYYALSLNNHDKAFPTYPSCIDYPAEALVQASAPAGSQSFTFYTTVNERGVNMASTSTKTKPLNAPAYSTYIRVYGLDSQGAPYVYKIYPGANMVNDYNLRANHRYTIDLSINSAGGELGDGRVYSYQRQDLVSANSFILNPAPEGTVARVFTIPIDKVNEFWRPVDNSMTIAQGDQWQVEVIWQDVGTPDMLRFVDLSTEAVSETFRGTGPDQRFAVSVKAGSYGNVSVGIKKVGGQDQGYLWSWHLWVTDYDPHYTAQPLKDTYVYPVTGGYVHHYHGTLWGDTPAGIYGRKYIMDRNIGSRSAEYSVIGTVYYQFGRKDPFPLYASGNQLYSITGVPLSDSDPKNASSNNKDVGKGVTFAEGVLNPTFFYYKTVANNQGDWCLQGRNTPHSWNAREADANAKSIYDPCPAGWKVPAVDYQADFVYNPNSPSLSTVINPFRDIRLKWNYGGTNGIRYWPKGNDVAGSVYYPASGMRWSISGAKVSVNAEVYQWTSTTLADGRIYYLYGYVGSVGNNASPRGITAGRAAGFTVRCVQE